MEKILVAYFSASGVTEKLAKNMADAFGCTAFEIVPQFTYTTADLNWMNKRSRSSVEMADGTSRPKITSVVDNMEQYDVIFVGFPIWWYRAPTIINTFLEQYDFTGKIIVPFATSGSSGYGKSNDFLADSCKGAKLLDGKLLNVNASKESLIDWKNSILK